MLLNIFHDIYDYINEVITYNIIELLCGSSCFSEIELCNLWDYVEYINRSYNTNIIMENLNFDHLSFVYDNETYLCVYKMQENLYVAKTSNGKYHRCIKTLSEIYDIVVVMVISKKMKKIHYQQ